MDAEHAHYDKVARAFEEIEEILGTADLSETVEMVRLLKQEADDLDAIDVQADPVTNQRVRERFLALLGARYPNHPWLK